MGKRKPSCPCQNSSPSPSSPWAGHYTDCAIPGPIWKLMFSKLTGKPLTKWQVLHWYDGNLWSQFISYSLSFWLGHSIKNSVISMRSLSHDNRRASLYITPELEELLHASFSTAFSKSVACLKSYMTIQNHKQYVREVLQFHSLHYTCMCC